MSEDEELERLRQLIKTALAGEKYQPLTMFFTNEALDDVWIVDDPETIIDIDDVAHITMAWLFKFCRTHGISQRDSLPLYLIAVQRMFRLAISERIAAKEKTPPT